MYTLTLDRSSQLPSLAVFKSADVVLSHSWQGAQNGGTWLAEARALLTDAGIALTSIDRFVCGTGPGSFSGIRACLAAVNGLVLPSDARAYGVASAAAIAAAQNASLVTVVGDARRNRLWCVTYQIAEGRLRLANTGGMPTHTADDFQLVPTSDLARAIPTEALVVSPDWERLAPVLESTATRLIKAAAFPSAEVIGKLALAEPSALRPEPSPIYLHPAV